MSPMSSQGDEFAPAELQLLIDSIPALIHSSLPDGYLDYFNQRWLEYVGVPLEDIQGWKWRASIHPDDVVGIVDKWRACLASGDIFEYEARVRRADGEYRWMVHRKVPVRDGSGNIVKWYGSSIDIEDRKQSEEALRESEQRFRDYAETASDWLWETGPDHLITQMSENLNAAGIAPSRVPGVTRWDIATDTESEPEKWRLHRAMLDAHRPFRDFVYS